MKLRLSMEKKCLLICCPRSDLLEYVNRRVCNYLVLPNLHS